MNYNASINLIPTIFLVIIIGTIWFGLTFIFYWKESISKSLIKGFIITTVLLSISTIYHIIKNLYL